MLILKSMKMRAILIVAAIGLALAGGAVTAHAQVFCQLVQRHPAGDIVTVWGPYGPYQVVVPCRHWVRACD